MKIYEGLYNERPSTTDIKRVDIIRYSVTEPSTDDIKQYLEDNSQPYFESAQEKQEFFEENTFFDIEALDADYEELFTLSDVSLTELKNIFDYRIVNMIMNSEGRQISQAEKELRDLLDLSLDDIDLNDVESVNKAAKQIFGESIYLNGFEGYILTDGTCIHFGKDKDHASISAIYSKETGESMTPGRFVSLGNIRIRRNNINLEKCPTIEQARILKKVASFYRYDKLYLEVSEYDFSKNDMYGNSILNVVFDNQNPEGIVAQIIRYFKEGIKPTGSIVYEDYKDEEIDYWITEELLTRWDAIYKQHEAEGWLDFFYEYQFIPNHIDEKYIDKVLESKGINHRFDNVFDELVNLVYNNFNKIGVYDTSYSYFGIIRRKPDESEKDFINRCCEKTDKHTEDKNWHPIKIEIINKPVKVYGRTSRTPTWNEYILRKLPIDSLSRKDYSSFDKDDITIQINIKYQKQTVEDIAMTIQHELTHVMDLFNCVNLHIFNQRSMIRSIDDVFNISDSINKELFTIIDMVCYHLARCEQVAFFNGLYKYVLYKYKDRITPFQVMQETIKISNIDSMKKYINILKINDNNISSYVYFDNNKNTPVVMMIIILSYYLKYHKLSGFDINSKYLTYEWISNKLNSFKNYIEHYKIKTDSFSQYREIGKHISMKELDIDVDEYNRIRKAVIDAVENNFENYYNEVNNVIEQALDDNGLMTSENRLFNSFESNFIFD